MRKNLYLALGGVWLILAAIYVKQRDFRRAAMYVVLAGAMASYYFALEKQTKWLVYVAWIFIGIAIGILSVILS